MLATVKVSYSTSGKTSGSEGEVYGVVDIRCTTSIGHIVSRARSLETGDCMFAQLPDAVTKVIGAGTVLVNDSLHPLPRNKSEMLIHEYKRTYDRKNREHVSVTVGIYQLSVPRIDPCIPKL
jgi:hypothetical protein